MHIRSSGIALAALVTLSASPALFAQQVKRGRLLPRVIRLDNCEVSQLAVDPTGLVRLAATAHGTAALVDIGLTGDVRRQPLAGLNALAISSDGAFLAGIGEPGDQGYGPATWWAADQPAVAHRLGEISVFSGVESTPDGLVLVGSQLGEAIDMLPPAAPAGLPGIPPLVTLGQAYSLSGSGAVYCGEASSRAVRWVQRALEVLDNPQNLPSIAHGVSRDGASCAGIVGESPAVWLAQDGLTLRTLRDRDGTAFTGTALGILDGGLTFGEGQKGSERFGWIWHPALGTNSVIRIQDWLAQHGLPPVAAEAVTDVELVRGSYHFALRGPSILSSRRSWYAQTPTL